MYLLLDVYEFYCIVLFLVDLLYSMFVSTKPQYVCEMYIFWSIECLSIKRQKEFVQTITLNNIMF